MHNWHLIHTKIRQERTALENLEIQGFECFLPLMRAEKLRRGALQIVQEALFPRYLFIRLGTGLESQSWAPIRSTTGVSRLVTFGQLPAKVDDELVDSSLEALENILEVDEAYLRASKEGKTVTILLVLGNEPGVAICDYNGFSEELDDISELIYNEYNN